eukprot:scaffold1740_cov150-Skeletonema_dohrnii-CCMP3373.AAC.4
MDISKAIVEAIYSKTPPGRFLKKCPDTGQWNELSRREAADRAAQAMAYVIKGESLKEKRRQRRSLLPPSLQSKDDDQADDVCTKPSSQSINHPTNNHSEGINHSSSSVAHHGLDTRREGAAGTSDDVPSASELLRVPEHINLQEQLLLQQLQQSSTTNLPTSVDNPQLANQNVLAQLMFQSLQQQQIQQQQLPLQYTMGQNPFGIQTQIGLTPQMLNQAQQQQQQHNEQQQLFVQHQRQRLLNQQNELPLPSPSTLSLSAPISTGHRSQLANNTLLQTIHLQSNPSFGVFSNAGISNAPQEAQQMEKLQRSLLLQQNQLLASSLGASSNNQLPFQQQQSQQLDPLLPQGLQADPLHRRNLHPLPSINSTGMASSIAAQSTRREEESKVDAQSDHQRATVSD